MFNFILNQLFSRNIKLFSYEIRKIKAILIISCCFNNMEKIKITETDLVDSEKRQIIILLIASTLISLFLFYIDEGYYDFNWMNNIGNWIAFMFYTFGIFGGQILFSKIILKKISLKLNLILSIILGSIFSLWFLILGFLSVI
ncbi:MAG: hypothetical protein C0595_04475 [Marinilabiliales bacterium]|nr:MAG: hypothetical protein C0595_04475 [Marinilabiliales bacterium]